MDINKEEASARHEVARVTSVLVRFPLLSAAVGAGAAYYSRATITRGFADFPDFLLVGCFAFMISMILRAFAARLFYGPEVIARYWPHSGRGYPIPDRSLFFGTLVSDLGAVRKGAGYAYALAQVWFDFLVGALLCVIVATLISFRGPAAIFWCTGHSCF